MNFQVLILYSHHPPATAYAITNNKHAIEVSTHNSETRHLTMAEDARE